MFKILSLKRLMSSLLLKVKGTLGSIEFWLSANLATVLKTNLVQVLFSFIILEEYALLALCWLSYMLWDSIQAKQQYTTLVEYHFLSDCHVDCFILQVSGLNHFRDF